MNHPRLAAGVASGLVLTAALFLGSGLPASGQTRPAPEATATVKARQTATAQARAEKAAQPQPTPTAEPPISTTGNVVVPDNLGFSDAVLSKLHVPAGFWVNVYAKGLGNTRMIAVAPNGTTYVTRREQGDLLVLIDHNGDGQAEDIRTVASGYPYINGVTIHEGQVYFATDHDVYVAAMQDDGSLSTPKAIITDLPDAGQHPNRTLAVGPDGKLYITVGSTCNVCSDTNPENATILRANLNGSGRQTVATGLRNTIGFGWHPGSGQLWGMDHGSDWRGDDQPPEELNLIQEGGNYGWPFCYGKAQVDQNNNNDPPGTTKAAYCATTKPAILTYQAHSAPLGLQFYTGGQFPSSYQGDAFVTMRGSWNRNPPTGYKVVRVRFENGWPVAFDDFMTGFLTDNGAGYYGRPVGIAQTPYGSLLVSDDTNGVIYRISWAGK